MKVTAIVTPQGRVTDCIVDGVSIAGAIDDKSSLIIYSDHDAVIYAQIPVTDLEIRQQAADGTQPGQAGA